MFTLRTTTAIAAVAAGLATSAAAQDAFAIPEIVVSANLDETEADRTGATVTVLTEEDLDKTGEARLTDILARQPGVGIRARGPLGTQTGLTIRGVSQNYIKVVFDGIDIADPSSTQVFYDFGRLTSFGLDRVEILRGSQSAVYGSQAIGGVVSLTTGLPDEIGTEQSAEIEAGSYGTLWGSYGYGIRTETGAAGFTRSHITTDGFSAANEEDGNTEADGYRATRLSARGEALLGDGVLLTFSGFAENSEGDYDQDFPLQDGTPDEVAEAASWGLRLGAEFDAAGFQHEVSASVFRMDRILSGSDGFGANFFDYVGERETLGWTAARPVGTGTLTLGADATWERYSTVNSFGSSASADTETYGLFAEYDFALTDDLDMTATLRRDDHSTFGAKTVGRLAAAWRPAPDWVVRMSAATGYRAPSGYEMTAPFGGNPNLTEETSRSLDFGVERRFAGGAMVKATLFSIETDDLIDYVGGNYVQVPGTTLRRGLELEGEAPVSERLRLSGAYTFTESDNPALSTGSTWNSGFGRHQIALGLDADLSDRLTASVNLLAVADRPVLSDYAVANATFTYDLGNAAEAYLRIENLTDESYELVDGYGTSGRAFYVGLRKSF